MKYRKSRIKQSFLLFIVLAFSFSVFSGCGSIPSFPPDLSQEETKETVDRLKSVSDVEVFAYSGLVMDHLQGKANFYRLGRKTTTTIGTLAAAFGTGIHGAFKADADTLTMVAGVATIMPLLQQIWKAGKASEAQEEGVDLISQARSKFVKSIGENVGSINSTKVTAHGSILFDEVNAAVIVVRAAVAQTIPKLKDLKTAMGEVESLKAFPGTVKMHYPSSEPGIVMVKNDRVVLAVSDNVGVAKISAADLDSFRKRIPLDMINIDSVGTGTATISLFNAQGGGANVIVDVSTPAPVPPVPAVP